MGATVTSRATTIPPLVAPVACCTCLVGGAAYVTANDPSESPVFLPCPFRVLTGLWCPGCGLTRATHHLFRGDLLQALRYNLFVVAILVGVATAWLWWALDAAGRPVNVRIPLRVPLLIGATLLAFAVVRNLPAVDGLRG